MTYNVLRFLFRKLMYEHYLKRLYDSASELYLKNALRPS